MKRYWVTLDNSECSPWSLYTNWLDALYTLRQPFQRNPTLALLLSAANPQYIYIYTKLSVYTSRIYFIHINIYYSSLIYLKKRIIIPYNLSSPAKSIYYSVLCQLITNIHINHSFIYIQLFVQFEFLYIREHTFVSTEVFKFTFN